MPRRQPRLSSDFLSLSGKNGLRALASSKFRSRSLFSMVAIFVYAQCVVRKYDGIVGFGAPRRSSRTKRLIELSGVRNMDMAV